MGWNSGSDPDAIHDNVSGEISAVTEKTILVDADLVLIEDSAGGNVKRKAQVGNLPGGGGGGGVGSGNTTNIQIVTKAADESVTSSTTLQDDDELLVSIAADEVWVLDAYLRTDGATGGDIKVAVKGPTGVSGHFMVLGPGTTATTFENATANNQIWPVSPTPTGLPAGTLGAGNDTLVHVHAVIRNGSTAGSVVIQWAQNTSSGTATKVLTNSYLVAQREDQTASLIAGWSPILDYKSTTDTPDDEFDSTTLDAKWTAVTGSSGTVDLLETGEVQKYDLTTRPGWLLMQAGSAANQKVELRQDWTLGDGESIIVAMSFNTAAIDDDTIANNELWAGISINDNDAGYDAGEWHALFFDVNEGGWRLIHFDDASFTHGTTVPSAVNTDNIGGPIAQLVYFRFARSGSVVHAFWSHDGTSWMSMGSDTPTATATNLWIFVESLAAANEPVPIVAVDWIRQGTNNLDPWSHSGLVQLDTVPDHVLRLDNPLTSGTDDDEFDDDTIDAAWTSLTVTGSATWTEQDDVLSVVFDDQTAGDAAAQIKSINGTPAAAIEISTAVRAFTSANHGIVGMFFSDGTTATSNLVQFRTNVSDGSTSMYGGTFTDLQNTLLSTFTVDASSLLSPIYMRLTWVSSNTWRMEVSPDGVSWTAFALADQSRTLTPTHYGLYVSSYGGTVPKIATFEYFRSDAP
jgi:hypothetical protein